MICDVCLATITTSVIVYDSEGEAVTACPHCAEAYYVPVPDRQQKTRQVRVTLIIQTDLEFPSTYPEVSIEVDTVVSIIPEGTEEDILGRVRAIRYERVDV